MNNRSNSDPTFDQENLSPRTVRAVSRALALLKSFEGSEKMQLRDVAEKANLDRATARRLLLTLMEEGMVFQHGDSGLYSLGPMIRRLARSFVEVDLRQLAAPLLERMAVELGLTVFLSEYRNHNAVCLDRFHDRKGMEVHFWPIGGTLQANCAGAPKVLLAWQSAAEIDEVLSKPMTALTDKTTVNRKALKTRLRLIRKRGWELAEDDVVKGLSALAVPLLNVNGELRGCVSLAGLNSQMVVQGEPVHLSNLIALAEELRPLLN
jgi:DNA-binding IclR family transcriptional regulator